MKPKDRDAVIRKLHAEGYTNGQIARVVGIDRRSVGRRLQKMGLHSNLSSQQSAENALSKTLCWTCQNALGGCSWTERDPVTEQIRFQPVEGWLAKKTIRRYTDDHGFRLVESYDVLYCPSYRPDPPREPVLPGPTPLAIKPPPARDPCVGCNNFGLCSNRGCTCKDKATWEVAYG